MLETLPLEENSDDFVFDNQMLAQAVAFGFRIGEISCPTRYFAEASSINFRRSVVYGFGVLGTALSYRLHRMGVRRSRLFEPGGRRLPRRRWRRGELAPSQSPALTARVPGCHTEGRSTRIPGHASAEIDPA